jgi:S-DNA-T family DNA segregation ATPase FtsK/SpoIIIE
MIPVVTDPKKAAGALNWAVQEMTNRYKLFADHNVRDIKGYNKMKKEKEESDILPQIVIIVDELADLMMTAPGEVEEAICRLAQMARAAGLHLVIATQRPSVDVITGVIKANIPSRLAFSVSSGTDSRTILDMTGAEKLLGKGDMLFYPVGASKPVRIQGAFISDKEVEKIVESVKQKETTAYNEDIIEQIETPKSIQQDNEEVDEYLQQAIELVVGKEKASISMIQRAFRIGFNRAARLMEEMEARGIVGSDEGSKPRKVLMTQEELEQLKQNSL